MAIYTGGMRQQDEARKAAKSIAAQHARAQKGEAKRKGRAGIFGKLGGLAMGTLAVGAMGLTGGLAAPLVMGLASSLGKKFADDASQGKWGKTFKTPGQVGKIEATGKYGYGREEAASLTSALQESRKTEFDLGTIATDVGSAYLSAGMSGKLGGAKGLLKGDLSFGEALTTGSKDAWQWGGVEGMKSELGSLISFKDEGGNEIAQDYDASDDFLFEAGESAGYAHPSTYTPSPSEQILAESDSSGYNIMDLIQNKEQGGQVMDQNTLIGLAILSEMGNQQKAYDNTPLEEEKQQTISEMFASKGKTLGGNNTQSIAQMLGR